MHFRTQRVRRIDNTIIPWMLKYWQSFAQSKSHDEDLALIWINIERRAPMASIFDCPHLMQSMELAINIADTNIIKINQTKSPDTRARKGL
jgi:hypothetical protein